MPIANCFVTEPSGDLPAADDIVRRWSEASGVDDEHMTVNIIAGKDQGGHRYPVMVWLYLPDLWTEADVVALQEGIASAWTRVMGAADEDRGGVHVITSIIESGRVVEDEATLAW